MSDANSKIQGILRNRAKTGHKVQQWLDTWEQNQDNLSKAEVKIRELVNLCKQAEEKVPDNAESIIQLREAIKKVNDRKGRLEDICKGVSNYLRILSERFKRNTINIAVAGVGRCGKSTALKSIIGDSQDDNNVIPTGNGAAVTAGKSVICCVDSEDQEKTEVIFHDEKTFLDMIINPLIKSIGLLKEYQCDNINQFKNLDITSMKKTLRDKQTEAQEKVKAAEMNADSDAINEAKSYAASFNAKNDQLSTFDKILNSFPDYQRLFNEGIKTVNKEETAQYISYPQDNNAPRLCYAVRECKIYSRFPNNSIGALQLIDLPGLGTNTPAEKDCFLQGFNYTVDLALIVRRPATLFANFPTEEDLNVLDVLTKTFNENVTKCAVLFQNDANLPGSDIEDAYKQVENWNKDQKEAITVLRGDASDVHYMQNELLPKVLDFMTDNLPDFDENLLNESLQQLERWKKEYDEILSQVSCILTSQKSNFPSCQSVNLVTDKSEEVLKQWLNGVGKLREAYENEGTDKCKPDVQLLTDAVLERVRWLNTQLKEIYNPENENTMEDARNKIDVSKVSTNYAIDQIHSIRVLISEGFAELENTYGIFIQQMQKQITEVIQTSMPNLFKDECSLDDFLEKMNTVANKLGPCAELVEAVTALRDLHIPFYTNIYPELRKSLFMKDPITELQQNFLSLAKPAQADKVIIELYNIGINWVSEAKIILLKQNKVTEIIAAALERFVDRTCRNKKAIRDMNNFIQYYLAELQDDSESYNETISTKLNQLQDILEKEN